MRYADAQAGARRRVTALVALALVAFGVSVGVGSRPARAAVYQSDDVIITAGVGEVKQYRADPTSSNPNDINFVDFNFDGASSSGMGGACLDTANNTYAVNTEDGTVSKLDDDLQVVASDWVTGLNFPTSCVVLPGSGNVVVAQQPDATHHSLEEFTPAGSPVAAFDPNLLPADSSVHRIGLANDGCNVFYSNTDVSGPTEIRRFNVCNGTQGATFSVLTPTSGGTVCGDIHQLPVADNGTSVVIACQDPALAFIGVDAGGTPLWNAPLPSAEGADRDLISFDFTTDNTMFRSVGRDTGNAYKFNADGGAIENEQDGLLSAVVPVGGVVIVRNSAPPDPTAVLTPTPSSGPAPLDVDFDVSSSHANTSGATLISYSLDFGDGSPPESGAWPPSGPIAHTYPDVGTFDATLTVTDSNLDTGSDTVTIDAQPTEPTAVLNATPTSGKAPLAVDLCGCGSHANSPGGSLASWTIDYGDGHSDSGPGDPPSSISHTYTAPGTFDATLTVVDNFGAAGTDSVTIQAQGPPTASLGASTTSGTAPLAVTFNGSGSHADIGNGASLVSWTLDFGDGQSTSGSGTPPSSIPHTYASAGSFTATLTVADNNAQTATQSVTITVSAPVAPTASLSAHPPSGTAPLGVSFDGSGSTPGSAPLASWTLNFGDAASTSGSGTPPSAIPHTYNAPGSYTATLTVTDANNLTGTATASVTVTAPNGPTASLVATPSSGVAPLPVNFDGSGSHQGTAPLNAWTLAFGDGATTGGAGTPPAAIPHTYAAPGAYTATLTVTDGNNLSSSAQATVTVAAPTPPTASLNATPSSGTAPLVVSLDGSASHGNAGATLTSWTLAFGDGQQTGASGATVAPVSHTYASPGTYTATLTVTDSHGLTGSASATVSALAPVPPTASLTAAPTSGTTPLPVTFNGSTSHGNGGATLTSWSLAFGDGQQTNGTGTPPAAIPHTFSAAGAYTATLSIVDSHGLTATATAAVSAVAPAPPTAVLSANPASGTSPLSSTLNGAGSHANQAGATLASWTLSFGDGQQTSGTGAPPAAIPHTFSAAGTFTASLRVTDSNGQPSTPATTTISVTAPPPPPKITTTTTTVPRSVTPVATVTPRVISPVITTPTTFAPFVTTPPLTAPPATAPPTTSPPSTSPPVTAAPIRTPPAAVASTPAATAAVPPPAGSSNPPSARPVPTPPAAPASTPRPTTILPAVPTPPSPPSGPPVVIARTLRLRVDRPTVEPGGRVTAIGDGCDANQQVSLELGGKQVGSTVADEHGHFSAPLDVGDTGVGDYDVIARCGPTLMTRLAVSQTERSDQPVTTLLLLSFFVVGAMVLFHRSLGLG